MIFGSVCSGIEAASVAWHPLGWRCAFVGEIEPFPCALLSYRYPEVPNFGDLTKWREWPVDVLGSIELLVGGTPCQSFSVAGLRQGMTDARGNLMLSFIELANAIDDIRRDHGLDPIHVLWENVPGVFSDKTNGFGALLGGLCGSDAAVPCPPRDGWSYAGVASGPSRVAAWRTLDAQFFGVAQRRRRVFVLARGGSRAWQCADALLPLTEGMRGDTAPQRKSREGVTGTIEASLGRSRGAGTPTPSLTHVVTGCLNSSGGHAVPGTSAQDADQGFLIPDVAWALQERDAKGADSNTKDGHLIPVAFKASHYTRGKDGAPSDVAPPLSNDADKGDQDTLISFAQNQRDEVRTMDVAGALASNPGMKQQTYLAFSCKDYGADAGELSPTLRSMNEEGGNANGGGQIAVAITPMSVRRLTPRECERLQGFPDDYTLIPHRGKPAADGPRYKALGNSMAVPVMRWIGQRIERASATERAA